MEDIVETGKARYPLVVGLISLSMIASELIWTRVLSAEPLDRVHNDALVKFKQDRRSAGRMAGTINKELAVVRRILNLAARVWRHPNGQTWLPVPPLLEMGKGPARRPYPISWEEQGSLFRELPAHLERIALFAVNTGCRSVRITTH